MSEGDREREGEEKKKTASKGQNGEAENTEIKLSDPNPSERGAETVRHSEAGAFGSQF